MNNNTLWDILFVFSKAEKIRKDEEKREKSVRFAVETIIFSIFTAAFAVAGGLLITGDSAGFFIVGIILLILALSMLVLALVRLIAQFTINRHAMTWVALGVFLASIIAPVIAVIILLL